jgi:hypothetical protein
MSTEMNAEETTALKAENQWLWYEIAEVKVKARLRKSELLFDVVLPSGEVVPMWAPGFKEIAVLTEPPLWALQERIK